MHVLIIVRMRDGLSREDRTRVWNEAVGVLGPDRRLVGAYQDLATNIINLPMPLDLGLGEHYAMIRKLNGIDGVVSVYQDNGERAESSRGSSHHDRGRVRAFLAKMLDGFGMDDLI